jgi:hypothetical protein
VGVEGKVSDLNRFGTGLEVPGIDWNEFQIRKNSRNSTGTKMAEKLNSFENLK